MSRRPNTEAREKILEAARRLFYEGGYKGVSMDAVAFKAGIKKANLFHYYPTKEDLGLAVFQRACEMHRRTVADRFAAGKGDPISAVRRMFEETGAWMEGKGCSGGCFIGNLAQEMSDHNERMRRLLAEHFGSWTEQVASFLNRARLKGYFQKEFIPQAAAESLIALFQGALLVCKARKEPCALMNAGRMAGRYLKSYKTATLKSERR